MHLVDCNPASVITIPLTLSLSLFTRGETRQLADRGPLTERKGPPYKLRAILWPSSCARGIDYQPPWMGPDIFFFLWSEEFLGPHGWRQAIAIGSVFSAGPLRRYWCVLFTSMCQQTPLFDMDSAIKWSILAATRYIVNGLLFPSRLPVHWEPSW